jgi:hypothetical protein
LAGIILQNATNCWTFSTFEIFDEMALIVEISAIHAVSGDFRSISVWIPPVIEINREIGHTIVGRGELLKWAAAPLAQPVQRNCIFADRASVAIEIAKLRAKSGPVSSPVLRTSPSTDTWPPLRTMHVPATFGRSSITVRLARHPDQVLGTDNPRPVHRTLANRSTQLVDRAAPSPPSGRGVEAFGEPVVDLGERHARFGALALLPRTEPVSFALTTTR